MSFRLKIVLGILLIQSLLLVILISISLNFLRLSNEIELSKRASSVATLFSVTIRDAVIWQDHEAVRKVANVILGQPGIIYARVISGEEVIAAAGPNDVLARPFTEDFLIDDVNDGVFDVYSDISEKGKVFGRVEVGVSIDEIAHVMDAARRQISTIAVIGMGFSILMSVLLGNYFAKQLKSLRDASRSIASGNIGYQLYMKGDDELSQTANAFNTMSRKLALLYSEKQEALQNAEKRATDLREKERRINAILDNAVDGIITMDEYGEIESFNPAAERMFGYTVADILGQSITVLMDEPHASEYKKYIEKYNRNGSTELVGVGREVAGRGSSGNTFPMELDVSELEIEGHTLFVAIVRDISPRKQAEQALYEAQIAALESARAKFEFIANVSHELRVPMNGMLAMINLLHDTGLTDEQREYVESIHDSGSGLITIINDVLDYSRIEAGQLNLESLDFDLEQTIEDVCNVMRPAAGKKQLDLVYMINGTMPTSVQGDPARLRQILMNLVDNAVSYTRKGEVIVSVEKQAETDHEVELQFEVRDTGVGLSPKAQRTILEDHLDVKQLTARKAGRSSGLGIAISRKLLKMMGGEMGLDSKVGQGSTFWFRLKLAKQQDVSRTQKKRPYSELSGLRVLVVDNRGAWRGFLQTQMESIGMATAGVDSVDHALAELQQATENDDPYDLVVFDMMMPKQNGLQLARMIQANEEIVLPKMIMVATTGYRGDSEEVRRAGIAGYLTTPVRTAQLYECIATVMRMEEDDTSLITRHSLADTSAMLRDHVLVIEDDEVDRKIALKFVQDKGYRVHYVTSIDEAQLAVKLHYYGCILIACDQIDEEGLKHFADFKARVMSDHPIKSIAILRENPDMAGSKCHEAGFDDYLVKPLSLDSMQEKLDSCVS